MMVQKAATIVNEMVTPATASPLVWPPVAIALSGQVDAFVVICW
jgi:hypothetical protein